MWAILSFSLTNSLIRKPLLLNLGIDAFIFWYLANFSAQKKDLIWIKIHITVFWGLTPCDLVDIYHHFAETCCSIFTIDRDNGLCKSAGRISQSIWFHISEVFTITAENFQSCKRFLISEHMGITNVTTSNCKTFKNCFPAGSSSDPAPAKCFAQR